MCYYTDPKIRLIGFPAPAQNMRLLYAYLRIVSLVYSKGIMNLKCLLGILALSLPTAALSQIVFDHAASSWGASGTGFTAGSGDTGVTTTLSGQAYYSGANSGSVYTFGFSNNSSPSGIADYNLSSTVLPASTAGNPRFFQRHFRP